MEYGQNISWESQVNIQMFTVGGTKQEKSTRISTNVPGMEELRGELPAENMHPNMALAHDLYCSTHSWKMLDSILFMNKIFLDISLTELEGIPNHQITMTAFLVFKKKFYGIAYGQRDVCKMERCNFIRRNKKYF